MSKVKSPPNQSQEPVDWAEQVQQHPAFEWMMENRQYIPYLFIALLAVIGIGYKLTSGSVAKAESNYQLAEGYWTQIQRNISEETGIAKQEDAINNLRSIVAEYPELSSKYDGILAQLLLAHGESEAAMPYAEQTEKRTAQTQDPLFKEFSDTTLLIAEGKLEEALQRSLNLKKKLLKQEGPPLLLPYSLIRIAMLHQGLGQDDLEVLAWDEWNQYANGKGIQKPEPQILNTISSLFAEGDLSLDKYIEARKQLN